jgi:hypothetical protein
MPPGAIRHLEEDVAHECMAIEYQFAYLAGCGKGLEESSLSRIRSMSNRTTTEQWWLSIPDHECINQLHEPSTRIDRRKAEILGIRAIRLV